MVVVFRFQSTARSRDELAELELLWQFFALVLACSVLLSMVKSNLGYVEKAILLGLTRGRFALISGERSVTCDCMAEDASPLPPVLFDLFASVRDLVSATHTLRGLLVAVLFMGPANDDNDDDDDIAPSLCLLSEWARGLLLSLMAMHTGRLTGTFALVLLSSFTKHGVKLSWSREVVGKLCICKSWLSLVVEVVVEVVVVVVVVALGAAVGAARGAAVLVAVFVSSVSDIAGWLKFSFASAVVGDWAPSEVSSAGGNINFDDVRALPGSVAPPGGSGRSETH